MLMFLLLIIFSIFPRLAVSVHHSNATDLAALLSFKSLVSDPNGLLDRSWNSSNTSFCTWFGVSCSPWRQQVVVLQLEGLSLHGTISPHLGNLSFMNRLDLSNNSLRGSIPHSLGELPRLASLALGYNQLSGRLPSAIFNMSSITYISFIMNNLSGPFLTDTVDNITVPRVQYLSVESNQLEGSIPSDFLLRCKDLQYLSLSTNQFRGSIPEELTRLRKLHVLYLDTNSLTGSISASIGNLTYLTKLDLSSNHLSGVIPPLLGSLMNLQWLTLGSNYLTGGIPTSLLNASMLGMLDLSDNNLTGTVPIEIGTSLPHLTFLGFGTNELSGGLEFITSLSHCKGLQRLHISYNELEGALPNSIGNLSGSLYEFDACGNRITGEIPATLGNLSGLLELCFDGNQLTGNIPLTIFNLGGLQVLDLGHNSLSGSIPEEIGRLNRLGELTLEYNALSGAIPDSIGNITALQFLWLHNNKLSSSIPDSMWSLSNLVGMYLFQNTLEGLIPLEVGNLVAINQLDLSANRLFGDIPDTFAQLQTLTILNVSNNSFQGPIPQSFSKLTDIQYLDLSLNEFSGPIPEFLADLHQLVGLNLSFNKFEGQVPTGGIFSNISFQSLVGNMNLCGSQELGLSPCSKSRSNKAHKLKIILPTIAASVVILLSFLAILLAYRWKSKRTISSSETPHLNMYSRISHHELVRATDNFSESNLLGTGSYGSVYRGRLDDESLVAVKVLHLKIEGSSRSFDSECSALRMIRHRNLVRIVSTCSNLDFKALVLEYMPNGSLERWLYSPGTSLSLLQRMRIMLDVTLALEYLHHHLQQAVVHCDIKPSNVLLDEDMNARVSDFGIAKLLSPDSKSVVSASAAGTIGYMPPEYGSTGRVSRRGDVYSFGILQLETFTGKKPTDNMFSGESNLRKWVFNAYTARLSDVVDANLLGDESSDGRETPDDHHARHRCLSSVIELALECSKDSPKERITMKEAVSRMQKMQTEYLRKLSGG